MIFFKQVLDRGKIRNFNWLKIRLTINKHYSGHKGKKHLPIILLRGVSTALDVRKPTISFNHWNIDETENVSGFFCRLLLLIFFSLLHFSPSNPPIPQLKYRFLLNGNPQICGFPFTPPAPAAPNLSGFSLKPHYFGQFMFSKQNNDCSHENFPLGRERKKENILKEKSF